MELIKVLTAGNVDDGKSTLLGRLLYETGNCSAEESLVLEGAGDKRDSVELSRLFDGLKDEREQGITIDVAYRYFYTKQRRFTLADCPGHIQYIKNLVVGAANSDVALVLVDAKRGVVEQTLRHIKLLKLLRVPNFLFVINKMDQVEYDPHCFQKVITEIEQLFSSAERNRCTFIPVSAQFGDNVVNASKQMTWFQGPTVIEYLETVPVGSQKEGDDLRVVIQKTLLDSTKKTGSARAYACRVLSGWLKKGDGVRVYPSGETSKVKAIFEDKRPVSEVPKYSSVAVTLEDELDLERGSLLGPITTNCSVTDSFTAEMFWLDSKSLCSKTHYVIRHTCQETKAKIEVDESNSLESVQLEKNQFAKVKVVCSHSMWFDTHKVNPETGTFFIIDPNTHNVAAVGLIVGS